MSLYLFICWALLRSLVHFYIFVCLFKCSVYGCVFGCFFTFSKTLAPCLRLHHMVQQQAFLSLSLSAVYSKCVCLPFVSFNSVFSLSEAIGTTVMASLCGFCFRITAWCLNDPGSSAHTHTYLVHPAFIETHPWPFVLSRCLSEQHGPVSLFPYPITTPTQSFRGLHSTVSPTPPLTLLIGIYCQATCLARAGWGVAKRLNNNFRQWNGMKSKLGTLSREKCPGLVL